MTLFLDGSQALTSHAWAVFVVLLIILWGFLITRGVLYRLFGDMLEEADLLSLGTVGWVVPVLFLSLFVYGLSLLFSPTAGGILAALIVLVFSFLFIRKKPALLPALILLVLVFVSMILRFTFLKDLVLPSYFDPVEHYRIIKVITDSYRSGILVDKLWVGFYHFGFHYLAAGVSFFFHLDILEFMLAFGQIVLALLPFPLFFIVKHETGSISAAFLASLLGGFGFHMPAHLMNWGKYPALLGLVCMSFVFGLACMAYRPEAFRDRKWIFSLMTLAVLTSVIVHSRTLVVFGMMCAAFFATAVWRRLGYPFQSMFFFLPAILIAIVIFLIYNDPVLKFMLDVYLKNDSWTLILTLLLTFFSASHYTRLTFFLFTWLALCGLCLFIPVTLPVLGPQTLLDRPFMQMFIYIPLSILGGLGLAGLTKMVKRLPLDLNPIERLVPFTIFGFVFLNAAANYHFYSSDCCRFVSRDDITAFTWMDSALPADANILIASTGLHVTSYESPEIQTGVDAGIWISPLLSRKTKFAGQGILFDLTETHNGLCSRGIDFIYVDSMPESFISLQLDSQPLWYSPSFTLPSAKVYQVMGCKG